PAAGPARRRRWPWLLPLAAAGLTLAAVVAAYVLIFSSLLRSPGPEPGPGRQAPLSLRESRSAARQLLREGSIHQALKLLQAARDEGGRHRLTGYEVLVPDEQVRVRLELGLLDRLPLDQPRRLLFGARLASVAREGERLWVVRFEADSGVLLTDEGAVAACGL